MKCFYCSKNIQIEGAKHGLHRKCFDTWFEVKTQDKDFQNLTLKQSSKDPKNDEDISGFNTSFFHGKFKKYSAEIAEQQYILKVQQNECPELPEIEFISNKIYLLFGVNVAKFYMIRFNNKVPTFVTKNFMKKNTPSNLVHIYHFFEKNEEYNCENLIRIIFNKCEKLMDIKRFIEMVLADSIIGNHDRHGRNIGLIQSGPSKYEMSPIYDNPSYIGIEDDVFLGADLNPVGKIFTSCSNEPTLSNYINEFARIGYGEIVEDFIKKILKLQNKLEAIIGQSTITEKRKDAFLKIINKRIGEIKK